MWLMSKPHFLEPSWCSVPTQISSFDLFLTTVLLSCTHIIIIIIIEIERPASVDVMFVCQNAETDVEIRLRCNNTVSSTFGL